MRRFTLFTLTAAPVLARHCADYHAVFLHNKLLPTAPSLLLTAEQTQEAASTLRTSPDALEKSTHALEFLSKEEKKLAQQHQQLLTERRSLFKVHAEAFAFIFHEMTKHWLTLGKALEEEKTLYPQFEMLHTQLDNLLSQKELDKVRINALLERIVTFTRALNHPSAASCTDFAVLLRENIHLYTPQKTGDRTLHHVDVQVVHNPQRP